MSVASQFSGGGIKSIQRGVITMSTGGSSSTATATITAVNTAKTMLNHCGCIEGYIQGFNEWGSVIIRLTSSTQVTASNNYGWNSYAATVSYEVIEFY